MAWEPIDAFLNQASDSGRAAVEPVRGPLLVVEARSPGPVRWEPGASASFECWNVGGGELLLSDVQSGGWFDGSALGTLAIRDAPVAISLPFKKAKRQPGDHTVSVSFRPSGAGVQDAVVRLAVVVEARPEDSPQIEVECSARSFVVPHFKEHKFAVAAPGARKVELLADFTRWKPLVMQSEPGGRQFSVQVAIGDSEWRYRYQVDGKPVLPEGAAPAAPNREAGPSTLLRLDRYRGTLTIRNVGGAVLHGSLQTDAKWLELSGRTFEVHPGAAQDIGFTVRPHLAPAPREASAGIVLDSDSFHQRQVTVSVSVQTSLGQLAPSLFDPGADPNRIRQDLAVLNGIRKVDREVDLDTWTRALERKLSDAEYVLFERNVDEAEQRGEWATMLTLLQTAVAQHPARRQGLAGRIDGAKLSQALELARGALAAGDLVQARRQAEIAQALNPSHPDVQAVAAAVESENRGAAQVATAERALAEGRFADARHALANLPAQFIQRDAAAGLLEDVRCAETFAEAGERLLGEARRVNDSDRFRLVGDQADGLRARMSAAPPRVHGSAPVVRYSSQLVAVASIVRACTVDEYRSVREALKSFKDAGGDAQVADDLVGVVSRCAEQRLDECLDESRFRDALDVIRLLPLSQGDATVWAERVAAAAAAANSRNIADARAFLDVGDYQAALPLIRAAEALAISPEGAAACRSLADEASRIELVDGLVRGALANWCEGREAITAPAPVESFLAEHAEFLSRRPDLSAQAEAVARLARTVAPDDCGAAIDALDREYGGNPADRAALAARVALARVRERVGQVLELATVGDYQGAAEMAETLLRERPATHPLRSMLHLVADARSMEERLARAGDMIRAYQIDQAIAALDELGARAWWPALAPLVEYLEAFHGAMGAVIEVDALIEEGRWEEAADRVQLVRIPVDARWAASIQGLTPSRDRGTLIGVAKVALQAGSEFRRDVDSRGELLERLMCGAVEVLEQLSTGDYGAALARSRDMLGDAPGARPFTDVVRVLSIQPPLQQTLARATQLLRSHQPERVGPLLDALGAREWWPAFAGLLLHLQSMQDVGTALAESTILLEDGRHGEAVGRLSGVALADDPVWAASLRQLAPFAAAGSLVEAAVAALDAGTDLMHDVVQLRDDLGRRSVVAGHVQQLRVLAGTDPADALARVRELLAEYDLPEVRALESEIGRILDASPGGGGGERP